ncbi:MAG: alpha/beta hydrolase [Acidobacteriota bacterium]
MSQNRDMGNQMIGLVRIETRATNDAFHIYPQRTHRAEVLMQQAALRERKPIDPELRRYLDAIAPPAPPAAQPSNAEMVQARRALMMKALEGRTAIPGLPNGVQVRDVAISASLGARLYTPPGATKPLPVLVYLHGGGWVAGSVATHDPFCRLLSEAAGIILLAVEYRLAPEHPFPAAIEDTLAAFRWAAQHAPGFGGDPRRLLLGGDSAGGNLAAVAANHLCAADAVGPTALLLLYPVIDHPGAAHASYTVNGTGYGLEASLMRWFWDQYAPGIAPDHPEISPLHLKTLPALPPALVATAEYDPLRDEGIAYADKLKAAGVAVTHHHAPDMHHNFPVHPGTVARFPQSVAALNDFAQWLRTNLAGAGRP